MNDEWSRCPICFEDYSLTHRPTTFICGHSTCLDHAVGKHPLRECPICRQPLRQNAFHVSYNLEEAARLFRLIKTTVNLSTIQLPTVTDAGFVQNPDQGMIHRDEIYARQLQAELNRENRDNPQRQTQYVRENRPEQAVNQNTRHLKACNHPCDLVSTPQCCTCSDRRPRIRGNRYEKYVDGEGLVHRAARNEYYCPTCKTR